MHHVTSSHITELDALVATVTASAATVIAGIGGGMAVDAAKYEHAPSGLECSAYRLLHLMHYPDIMFFPV